MTCRQAFIEEQRVEWRSKAEALLKRIEWASEAWDGACCPECRRLESEKHYPGCELAALIGIQRLERPTGYEAGCKCKKCVEYTQQQRETNHEDDHVSDGAGVAGCHSADAPGSGNE